MASWNFANIGLGNGLYPVRCHAITWTDYEILLIGPLSEILIRIQKISFKITDFENVVCKMLAMLSQPERLSKL